MIEIHHQNPSRARRVAWLLEELNLDYRLVQYDQDPISHLAPPEPKAAHSLGKALAIRDRDQVVFESGAIIDYLIHHHGYGRLCPSYGTTEYYRYSQFLHYTEGSEIVPLMLKFYTDGLGGTAATPELDIEVELKNHFEFLNRELVDRDYFVGNALTGADVQLSVVIQLCLYLCGRDMFPNLTSFLERIEARPAYRRAMETGDAYPHSKSYDARAIAAKLLALNL